MKWIYWEDLHADKQSMKFFYSGHLSPTLEKSVSVKSGMYLYITYLYYILFTHLYIGCAIYNLSFMS